jgi:hypothetical protein
MSTISEALGLSQVWAEKNQQVVEKAWSEHDTVSDTMLDVLEQMRDAEFGETGFGRHFGWSDGVLEYWSGGGIIIPPLQNATTPFGASAPRDVAQTSTNPSVRTGW